MDEIFLGILPDPLKKAELCDYFEQMKLGSKEAREKIIVHNIKYVIKVASKYSNTTDKLKELVSIGLIGLIKSVDTFDVGKNFAFSTYTTKCIKNEILMFIRQNKKYKNVISLGQSIFTDENDNEIPIEDSIMDIDSDFVREYEDKESYEIIRAVINQLPDRERIITMKYFGFINNQPMSQYDIAKEVGLSQSYVARIIGYVLDEVKIQLKAQGVIEGPIKKRQVKTRNK